MAGTGADFSAAGGLAGAWEGFETAHAWAIHSRW